MQINQRVHDQMVENVLHTKLKFFEENTQGMILNRFSKDVQTLDQIVYTFIYVTDVIIIVIIVFLVHCKVHNYSYHSSHFMSLGFDNVSDFPSCAD